MWVNGRAVFKFLLHTLSPVINSHLTLKETLPVPLKAMSEGNQQPQIFTRAPLLFPLGNDVWTGERTLLLKI